MTNPSTLEKKERKCCENGIHTFLKAGGNCFDCGVSSITTTFPQEQKLSSPAQLLTDYCFARGMTVSKETYDYFTDLLLQSQKDWSERMVGEKPIITRAWAMPSMHTFTIKPIAELLKRYGAGKNWADPFAGENSPAEMTNDHNPEKPTAYHLEAIDFVNIFVDNQFDGALFDPPYSYRQVSEHYKVLGKKATQLDTSTNFYNRVLNPLANKIKEGGLCISFGWNTNAMGKNRGFEIVEILIVAHGGHHNDTLVTVERKISTAQSIIRNIK